MKYNILYICTYLDENISERFGFKYASAGLRKKNCMIKALGDHEVEVVFVSIFSKIAGKLFPSQKYTNEHAKIIIPCFTTIPLLNYILNPLLTFFALLKICNDKKIDFIILYNCVYENVLPVLFLKLFWKGKVICQYEDGFIFENRGIKNILFAVSHRLGHFVSDALISNSTTFLDIFPKQDHMLFRGSIDHLTELSSDKEKGRCDKINVVFASAIDKTRGATLLIDFFNTTESKDIINKINFVMTGKGDKRITDRLRFAVDYYNGKGGSAEFKGFIDDEELIRIYSKADLFLSLQNPSLSFSKYCFPSKILEYYFYNKPVIATRVSDLNNNTFPNLFLIDYNLRSLEDSLCYSLQNIEELRQKNLGNNAFLRENYTDARYKDKVNHFLDKVGSI